MPEKNGRVKVYEGMLKGRKVICVEDEEGKIRCLDKKKVLKELPEECSCKQND